jgi:hypothetical protein
MRWPASFLTLLLSLSGSVVVGCAHMDAARELNPKPSETPLFQVPQNSPITTTPPAPSPYQMVPQPTSAPAVPKASPASPPDAAAAPSPAAATGTTDTPELAPARPTSLKQNNDPVPPPDTPPPPAPNTSMNHAAVKALCCLAENKQADAVLLLQQGYNKPDQELLLTLLTVAASLADPPSAAADPQQTTTANVQALEECVDHLRRYAALRLDKVCFCQWIDKFGVYDPLPTDHSFLPGSQVHVYVEVRNFASDRRGYGYETRLASRVKILDSQGKEVPGCKWSFNDLNRPEHSLSLRHDYFINYSLPLPRTMAPGHYKLVLHVEDLPTKRSAELPMDLAVTARPLAAN